MEPEIKKLKRLLASKMATIEKYKKHASKENQKKMRRKLINAINENKKKNAEPKEIIIEDEEIKVNRDIKELFLKNLSDNLAKENHGHRYLPEVMDICFAIFSISPHAYNTFRNVLELPSENTLKIS